MARFAALRTLWSREARPAPVRTFAMVAAAGGVSCLFGAAFPADPASPTSLLWLIAAVTLSASALVWWIGGRMPAWGMQALVALATLATSLAIYSAATPVGMIVMACAYLWVCVFVGFFFSQRAARTQMALVVVGFGAALLASDNHVPFNAWFFISVSLVTAGEVLGRQSARLRHEAHTDALTGLLNRKGLVPAAERAFSLADRTAIPLTAALIDLDHFKRINDLEGHAAGDRLLADLAGKWSAELEPSDILARLGGDEFLLVLVGSDRKANARLLERLRFVSPTAWSAGVVEREDGEDLSSCMARADAALYAAKSERRPHSSSPLRASAPASPTAVETV